MPQATTYGDGSVLNREDLADLMSVVEPEKTPVTSLIPKGPAAKAMHTEWGIDAMDEVEFEAVAEGADVDSHDDPTEHRARIGNYQEKLRKTWNVTREQNLVSTAGVADEVANAKTKKVKEIKRDWEGLICSDQEQASSNPTKLRGLGTWIQNGAQTVNPVPAAYRTPAASIDTTATSSLTDDTLGDVIQSVFEQSGDDAASFQLVAGPTFMRAVTNLQRATGTTTSSLTYHVNQDANEHKITLKVREYETDFGTLFMVPSLFNGRTSGGGITDQCRARAYLLNPDKLMLKDLAPLAGFEQDDNGAGPRGYVEIISTLAVENPLAFGKFAATA